MFNLKKELSAIPEGWYNYDELKQKLADILWNTRADLAPGFGVRDVLEIGFTNEWFRMTSDGYDIYVKINEPERMLQPCPFVASGGLHGDDCRGLYSKEELAVLTACDELMDYTLTDGGFEDNWTDFRKVADAVKAWREAKKNK